MLRFTTPKVHDPRTNRGTNRTISVSGRRKARSGHQDYVAGGVG